MIQPGQSVVVISTAHGLKFSEFKIGYHEGTLADVVARHRNPPVELPADAAAMKAEIGTVVGRLTGGIHPNAHTEYQHRRRPNHWQHDRTA